LKDKTVYGCVGCDFKSDKMYAVIAHYSVNPSHKKYKKSLKILKWTAEEQATDEEFYKNMLIVVLFFSALVLIILGIDLFLIGG